MTDRVVGGVSPHHPVSPAPDGRSARRWRHRLVALTLIVAGAVVTGYPVADTLVTNRELWRAAASYSDAVADTDPDLRTGQILNAQQYNARLAPQLLLDPWGDDVPDPTAAHQDYLDQLDGSPVMARLRVPAIDVDLPVFHDSSKAQLSQGVGHMYGTSLPVGGAGTHAVLAAHTGMRFGTFFDNLVDLTAGDTFFVDVSGETLTYRVDQVSVVEPDDVGAVVRVAGADYVTLLTCIDFPDHRRRLLVRGVRVQDAAIPASVGTSAPATPTKAVSSLSGMAIEPWMPPRLTATAIALALAAILLVVWGVGDRRLRRSAASGSTAQPSTSRDVTQP